MLLRSTNLVLSTPWHSNCWFDDWCRWRLQLPGMLRTLTLPGSILFWKILLVKAVRQSPLHSTVGFPPNWKRRQASQNRLGCTRKSFEQLPHPPLQFQPIHQIKDGEMGQSEEAEVVVVEEPAHQLQVLGPAVNRSWTRQQVWGAPTLPAIIVPRCLNSAFRTLTHISGLAALHWHFVVDGVSVAWLGNESCRTT